MTELLGVAALAVGGYWIVRRMKRKMAELEARLADATPKAPRQKPDGKTLVQDPATGRYRPADV